MCVLKWLKRRQTEDSELIHQNISIESLTWSFNELKRWIYEFNCVIALSGLWANNIRNQLKTHFGSNRI